MELDHVLQHRTGQSAAGVNPYMGVPNPQLGANHHGVNPFMGVPNPQLGVNHNATGVNPLVGVPNPQLGAHHSAAELNPLVGAHQNPQVGAHQHQVYLQHHMQPEQTQHLYQGVTRIIPAFYQSGTPPTQPDRYVHGGGFFLGEKPTRGATATIDRGQGPMNMHRAQYAHRDPDCAEPFNREEEKKAQEGGKGGTPPPSPLPPAAGPTRLSWETSRGNRTPPDSPPPAKAGFSTTSPAPGMPESETGGGRHSTRKPIWPHPPNAPPLMRRPKRWRPEPPGVNPALLHMQEVRDGPPDPYHRTRGWLAEMGFQDQKPPGPPLRSAWAKDEDAISVPSTPCPPPGSTPGDDLSAYVLEGYPGDLTNPDLPAGYRVLPPAVAEQETWTISSSAATSQSSQETLRSILSLSSVHSDNPTEVSDGSRTGKYAGACPLPGPNPCSRALDYDMNDRPLRSTGGKGRGGARRLPHTTLPRGQNRCMGPTALVSWLVVMSNNTPAPAKISPKRTAGNGPSRHGLGVGAQLWRPVTHRWVSTWSPPTPSPRAS